MSVRFRQLRFCVQIQALPWVAFSQWQTTSVWKVREAEGSSLHWQLGPPVNVPITRPPVQVEKEGPDIPSRRAGENLVWEFGGRLPAGQVNKSRWCAGCFLPEACDLTCNRLPGLSGRRKVNWLQRCLGRRGPERRAAECMWVCSPSVGWLRDNCMSQVCWEAGARGQVQKAAKSVVIS